MKAKVLITNNRDSITDDFFRHTDEDFVCMSTSVRYADIKIHMHYFEPDVICYCIGKDSNKDADNILKIQGEIDGKDTFIVLIGDRDDMDMLQQTSLTAVRNSAITLIRPVSIKRIQESISKRIEDIRKARELFEKKRQEEIEKERLANRKHILVVDDDPVMLRTIKRYLEEDYNVATAPSGKFALKFLEQKHTDLVLLDYEMPEMSGEAVFRRIKEMPEISDLPVVFLTGVSDISRIKAVLALQPNAYLLKPVEYEKLHEAINKIFKL